MNIMPYQAEKEKRQAFIYGSAVGGIVGFGIASFLLAAGGIVLYPKLAMQETHVPQAAVEPFDVATSSLFWKENFLPKPALAVSAQTPTQQTPTQQGGVVQARQISGQSAGTGGPVSASIPLPSVPIAPTIPAIQATAVGDASTQQAIVQAVPAAPAQATEAVPKAATASVVTQGANYQDGRIAFIGGEDVPIQSYKNGTR